jgi:micrococcal nuclease
LPEAFRNGLCQAPAAIEPALLLGVAPVGGGSEECDPSYPDTCIPPPPPDLDCRDIPDRRFRVIGEDPHRFDGDHNGIGCESS